MTPRRLYPDYTYSRSPIERCYWAEAVPETALTFPPLADHRTDALVIGGGFTGLNAAISLARAGIEVTLIDAQFPGFGASGRNGGFCCIGSHRASDALLTRRFGAGEPAAVNRTEAAAVAHVEAFLEAENLDVDRHSEGEVILAHTAAKMEQFRRDAEAHLRDWGSPATLIEKPDLAAHGLNGPLWHGAIQMPHGFALHPRKYLAGLAAAARRAGAQLHGATPALRIDDSGPQPKVITANGTITANRVLIATNGYASENLHPWLRGRYIPAQSSVLTTRPMTPEELSAQGFTSRQMSYEDRKMLHYFHLTPEGRMVFGMRGALRSSAANEKRIAARLRADFEAAFPAWKHVESPFYWSGMVCVTASLTPFCGALPGSPKVFAAFGYHGNGVAMGSYLGAQMGRLAAGDTPDLPKSFATPPMRFPLGRHRMLLLAAEYGMSRLLNR
ncbi:FAD-binding oxidoreductase [Pseudooceanicola sp. CBS1P-1]|uniref:FAD-dependent oxidoreductase n=1 Tax=Pseudooceanicola albus TaxID=2692189 RepID=A0A6L7FZY4_9RHOB|nr:FAD-binding oxidoreductase [Pseudooceanicola endophyticus]MXN16667.1 FAD-dependent oxidoreductase [Pseudooceanicola albus]